MENWYKFSKAQAKKQYKFGEYEILYSLKDVKEASQPEEAGKQPVEIHKETVKVLKAGAKVKVRKAEKLRMFEAIKEDNLEKLSEIVSALKG